MSKLEKILAKHPDKSGLAGSVLTAALAFPLYTNIGEESFFTKCVEQPLTLALPAGISALSGLFLRELGKNYARNKSTTGPDSSIFTTFNEVFYKRSLDKTMQYITPNAEKLLGYTPEEIIGNSVEMLYFNPQEQKKLLNKIMETGKIQDYEVQLLKKGGEIIEASVNSHLVYENGKPNAIQGVLKDITEYKNIQQNLQESAKKDHLTNVYNRKGIEEFLNSKMEEDNKSALLDINIADFKELNDNYGHNAGDEVLRKFARRLSRSLRSTDATGRVGGDEFVVYLNNITHDSDVNTVANKLLQEVTRPYNINDTEIPVNVNMGIALSPQHTDKTLELWEKAELALYEAKKGNKNYCLFYNDLEKLSRERIKIKNVIEDSIVNDYLVPYFQPVVNSEDSIEKLEALARINHPTEGLVSPARFIPIAEEKEGLMEKISNVMLEKACSCTRKWQEEGYNVGVSLNLAPGQLKERLYEDVMSILDEYRIPPSDLTLEITEEALMKNVGYSTRVIESLRKEGVNFSIDDFGTGYSCMQRLRNLEVDELKLDKGFVRGLNKTESFNKAVVRNVLNLSYVRNMDVIFEGVENKEELETLKAEAGKKYQGFYFAKPMPAEDMTGMLAEYLKS